ncbi:MAG: hypothetical protein ABIH51_01720 [Patescibacteria group bacterium]
MKSITKSKFNSDVVKFQTKIRNNLQLYYFSKDAIIYFSKFHKSEFKDYEFSDFINKLKGVSVKKTSAIKKIKCTKILCYGKNLIENELSDLIFVLNISDFEAWLVESFNLIFSSDYKILLRYLKPEKTSLSLSLLEQSNNIDEVWQGVIDRHLSNKFYGRKDELLRNLLSACDIKEDKNFKAVIGKINESFLCRNLIVHNKNKVNKEYLNKSGKYAKFTKGDMVKVSEEYLFEQGSNLLFFMQGIRKKLS